MSAPKTFRKKPVEIQAMQYDGQVETATLIIEWAMGSGGTISYHCKDGKSCRRDSHALLIPTLEGSMHASPGDWVIRGVEGEFYPCKPDIFGKTYDTVAEPAETPSETVQRVVDESPLRGGSE